MPARLTFLGIAAFWLTMNVLLWHAEFGVRGGTTPVPLALVWRKILTAPDASSLSVYQHGERMGYCEFSTGVGQQMSVIDEDRPPPEGFSTRGGYQLHLAGNVALGDFTNRLKFDGRVLFTPARRWQELNLKIISRLSVLEIYSLATNQSAHVKFSSDGELLLARDFTFAELQNPGALIRALTGDLGGGFFGAVDLPELVPDAAARAIVWDSRRTRVKIGTEPVPIYRLETSFLGHSLLVDVSTLGEILRIELPGGISARIDEWSKP